MISVLSFRIAGRLFGIEITKVKEINRNIEYTTVPRAPDTIVGLFNMRGQIVTLFQLNAMLGLPPPERAGSHRHRRVTCMILKAASDSPNQSGFIIDEPGDVLELDEAELAEPPSHISDSQAGLISKVVRLPEELLLLIEPNALFRAHAALET